MLKNIFVNVFTAGRQLPTLEEVDAPKTMKRDDSQQRGLDASEVKTVQLRSRGTTKKIPGGIDIALIPTLPLLWRVILQLIKSLSLQSTANRFQLQNHWPWCTEFYELLLLFYSFLPYYFYSIWQSLMCRQADQVSLETRPPKATFQVANNSL